MINKQYKDRLFKKVFEEDKANLLSLYNALNKTNYTDVNDLTVTTIDDVIYMGMKNDVSCLIDSHLSLFEQQSTVNPNMPLRGLMYFGKLYEQYIATNDINIYSSTLKKIPTPEYYVFYIGKKDFPERKLLKLSDAFKIPDNTGSFEWTATVININQGHNEELMKACKTLHEYSVFVDNVRRNLKVLPLEEAIEKTVSDCIEGDILAGFLLKHKAEVKDMVLTEYNEEKTMKAIGEECAEEAKVQANIQAVVNMLKLGISEEQIKEFYPNEFEEGLKRFQQS